MKNNIRSTIGIFLLIAGVLLLIDRLGFLWPFSIDFAKLISLFWPLLIVGLGIRLLLDGNLTWGAILATLGLLILTTRFYNWNFFAVLWPLIIIGLGFSILFRDEDGRAGIFFLPKDPERNSFTEKSSKSEEEKVYDSTAFSGIKKKITSETFKGGELNVTFGSYELDLREAKIAEKGANLNASVGFGEITIFVPDNCRVVTEGTAVLGSWEPRLKENTVEKPVLKITGSAILGEVSIRN
jgi:predicted membrane protein